MTPCLHLSQRQGNTTISWLLLGSTTLLNFSNSWGRYEHRQAISGRGQRGRFVQTEGARSSYSGGPDATLES